MTSEEAVAAKHFDAVEFGSLQNAVKIMCLPVESKLAQEQVRRLFWNSIIAAFHRGRATGMREFTIVMDQHLSQEEKQRLITEAQRGG